MATAPAVTDFGTFYVEEAQVDDTLVSTASASVYDLNDAASLLGDEVDVNAHLDAYATPPPPPDGRYRVKLKQINVSNGQGGKARFAIKDDIDWKTKQPIILPNGKPSRHATSAIEATIITGAYEGAVIYDYRVSTKPEKRNAGAIRMVRIPVILGHKFPDRAGQIEIVNAFLKTTDGEPEAEVDLVWEGTVDKSTSEDLKEKGISFFGPKGMHKFPIDNSNSVGRSPVMEYDIPRYGKVTLTARATIDGYFPLGSGKK